MVSGKKYDSTEILAKICWCGVLISETFYRKKNYSDEEFKSMI